MAWIESHQELRDHPKTKRAARLLGIGTPQMVGHLQFLWWWSVDYAEDGDLSRFDAFDVADAAGWDGDAEVFVAALIECGPGDGCGFLTEDWQLHDWYDFAGRLIEQRQLNRQRQNRRKNLYNDSDLTKAVKARDGDSCRYCGVIVNWNDRRGAGGGTYDHVDPDGDNSVDNIVVACRSCNSSKGRRKPADAGMSLLPIGRGTAETRQVPDRKPTDVSAITLPNQTKPDRTEPEEKQPLAPQKPARVRNRDPDLLFEAIAEAWKGELYQPGLLSSSQAALVGKAAAELRAINAAPEQVPREWAALRERFDNPTPAALAKHWGTNGTGPKQTADPVDEIKDPVMRALIRQSGSTNDHDDDRRHVDAKARRTEVGAAHASQLGPGGEPDG